MKFLRFLHIQNSKVEDLRRRRIGIRCILSKRFTKVTLEKRILFTQIRYFSKSNWKIIVSRNTTTKFIRTLENYIRKYEGDGEY